MKQLLIKSRELKTLLLCFLLIGTTFSFGQTKIIKSKNAGKTVSNSIDFQKKYIKQLRSQLKCNMDLLNVVEKEVRKDVLPKKNTKQYKSKLKRNKETLSSIKKDLIKMEKTLNTIGDDAQLANIDLQNMLQKQQQILQTMSNISKMLHDTAMAVIRKIG